MIQIRHSFRRVLCQALLLGAVFCLGASLRPHPVATAGGRDAKPKQEHFLAGSERSLPVLREISDTLKQIDARLARIEKLAAEAAPGQDGR